MAGNSTKIDDVVGDAAIEQFNALKVSGKELKTELVSLLEIAIKLTAVLGGSTPQTFDKNLKEAIAGTERLIEADKKVTANKQAQVDKQEKIINQYLVGLSKQAAEQERFDAKQIQQAEKQAAKLQAITDKATAEQARKAAVQFPTGTQSNNQITQEPDQPAVRYEPIITGEENMRIAINESTAAQETQLLSLSDLSEARIQTIKLLVELRGEELANTAALKGLNVENAAQAERQIVLIDNQLRLKTAIQQTNTTLSQQTKQILAEDTSAAQMQARLDELRVAYNNLSLAEKENIEIGGVWLAEIKLLDAAVKENAASQGVHNKEVGNYALAQNKASTATVLAEKVSAQFVRQLVRMAAQFLLITVIIGAVTWLYDYIKALDIFNPIATAAERAQKGLTEAFTSSDYEKGLANVLELGANLYLVKDGIEDSDTAINKYNETIGKTFGYVNNVNDAQQGFIDHKDAYIKTILDEAAAMAIANDAAKEMADIAVKNEQLREGTTAAEAKLKAYQSLGSPTPAISEAEYQLTENIKNNQKEILKNNGRIDLIAKNATDAIKGLDNNAIQSGGQKTGTDAIAELRNKGANDKLERQKIIAQKQISDDKLSYATRLQAVDDFYKASKQIADNNEALQLKQLPANDARKEDIEKDAANKLLELQQTSDTQRQQLRDKQYKQDEQILKNNLQMQRDAFKAIIDNQDQSFEAKRIALGVYQDRSLDLIKANYKEQLFEAGKNNESIKLAEQDKAKTTLQLNNEIAAETVRLQKSVSEKLKQELSDILKSNEDAVKNSIDASQLITDQSIQTIENQKVKEIAALNEKYAKGKILEKKYQDDLKAIQDQANIDRLGAEAFQTQAVLEIKKAAEDNAIANLQGQGGQSAIDAIRAKSGVSQAQIAVDKAGNALTEAVNKGGTNGAKTADDIRKEKQKEIQEALEDTKEVEKDAQDLINKGYENQISKLEKIGKLIEENATAEKGVIDRSLDTQENKARRQQILDAQTASQQKALQEKINQEKRKQAEENKAAAITEIILNTAIAISKTIAEGGIFGVLSVPIVAALGAVQLATAIAAPIPQFYKGGITPGGKVIVGERGTEHGRLPTGEEFYTPGIATVMNLPKGTIITPHGMLPETPNWVANRTDNSDVVNAINKLGRNQQPQRTPKLAGWVEAQRQADAFNRYSANHFK